MLKMKSMFWKNMWKSAWFLHRKGFLLIENGDGMTFKNIVKWFLKIDTQNVYVITGKHRFFDNEEPLLIVCKDENTANQIAFEHKLYSSSVKKVKTVPTQ